MRTTSSNIIQSKIQCTNDNYSIYENLHSMFNKLLEISYLECLLEAVIIWINIAKSIKKKTGYILQT